MNNQMNQTGTFGERLKVLRLKIGLTQAQFAEKLNISTSTIGMYEQNRREPDNETLLKICDELNTTVDYLLSGGQRKPPNLDINSVIANFVDYLETQDGLMINGIPINKKERKKIVKAIKFAADISIDNDD